MGTIIIVTLSIPFVFVNCASISAFISDPVFSALFYIPENYTFSSLQQHLQSVLSFYRE